MLAGRILGLDIPAGSRDGRPARFDQATPVVSVVHGLRYAEVADVLGVPQGTVKSRLCRRRRILQGKLRGYAEEIVTSERQKLRPVELTLTARAPGRTTPEECRRRHSRNSHRRTRTFERWTLRHLAVII